MEIAAGCPLERQGQKRKHRVGANALSLNQGLETFAVLDRAFVRRAPEALGINFILICNETSRITESLKTLPRSLRDAWIGWLAALVDLL